MTGCNFLLKNNSILQQPKNKLFIFSKFIYVNYNATFGFSKKESSYIAGSVYFVSMILAPVLGFAVVSQIARNTNSSE